MTSAPIPMIKYHPDARFLTDYAAGCLPTSQALCVATHLHYCPACRTKSRDLTELGAELFSRQPAAEVRAGEFDRLMRRIERQPEQVASEAPVRPANVVSILPRAVHKLTNGNLDELRWRRVGRNFRYTRLNVGDRERETSLFFIKAGGSVPRHHHKGDEITVILKGSFSDREDKYAVGDFIVRTRGETHRPVASQDQDCLCLSTLDAPIVMSNWLLRLGLYLMNRLNRPAPQRQAA